MKNRSKKGMDNERYNKEKELLKTWNYIRKRGNLLETKIKGGLASSRGL